MSWVWNIRFPSLFLFLFKRRAAFGVAHSSGPGYRPTPIPAVQCRVDRDYREYGPAGQDSPGISTPTTLRCTSSVPQSRPRQCQLNASSPALNSSVRGQEATDWEWFRTPSHTRDTAAACQADHYPCCSSLSGLRLWPGGVGLVARASD